MLKTTHLVDSYPSQLSLELGPASDPPGLARDVPEDRNRDRLGRTMRKVGRPSRVVSQQELVQDAHS